MAAYIKTYPMNNSAIIRITAERDHINTHPEYQRNSEIWTLEKKQLLIDSILNEFDIPKLYFHALSQNPSSNYHYAIIDGRQRIETIWAFIDKKFALATDFKYFKDDTIQAGGMTYEDLSSNYPKLKIMFDSFSLPIILVETDDTELIDDMFARLNEAVPLNAAEKRNAMGGPMVKAIKEVSAHVFFKNKVRFSNKRYQHREVSAHLLYLEDALTNQNKYLDTKKPYLDAMVKKYKSDRTLSAPDIRNKVVDILVHMNNIFVDNDSLLASQSTIPIYYLFFRDMQQQNKVGTISRSKFADFAEAISANREVAADDVTLANYDLLEYDRMTQQGTNDAVSIRERLRILEQYYEAL
jgi:hypothetical protein